MPPFRSRRRSRRPNVVSAVTVTLTLSVLAAACSGNELESSGRRAGTTEAPTTQAPTTTYPDPGPVDPASGFPADWQPGRLDWEPCDLDDAPAVAQCARLEVPLDWDQPDGESIELALARIPATGARLGSLVANPGGPGGSGVEFLMAQPFGDELAARFDLVSWDPRGVGDSTSLRCGTSVDAFLEEDPDPDDLAEQVELDGAAAAIAAECGAKDAELLPHLGTDDVARDLEAIRLALDESRLTYVGFSYGTLIGQRYLDMFGERVRAMVLDGVVDPTEPLTELLAGQTASLDAAMGRIFASCERRARCPLEDPAAAYDELRALVEHDPLPADHDIGPSELGTAAVYATYDPQLWEPFLEALADGLDGDGQALWELATGYYDVGDWTAYAAVNCLDSIHPVGAAAWAEFVRGLESVAPRFAGTVGNEMLPCAFWPVPVAGVTGPVTADDSPEVVVLGNTGDAATPYEDSVEVAEMLAHGNLVTYRGEGHTSYGRDECVDRVVHAYLIDLEVPPSDPQCGRASSVA